MLSMTLSICRFQGRPDLVVWRRQNMFLSLSEGQLLSELWKATSVSVVEVLDIAILNAPLLHLLFSHRVQQPQPTNHNHNQPQPTTTNHNHNNHNSNHNNHNQPQPTTTNHNQPQPTTNNQQPQPNTTATNHNQQQQPTTTATKTTRVFFRGVCGNISENIEAVMEGLTGRPW